MGGYGQDYWSTVMTGAGVGGFAAWASGSDINMGALAGGYGAAFNRMMHGSEGLMQRRINDELQGIKLGAKNTVKKVVNKGIRTVNKINDAVHSNYTQAAVTSYVYVAAVTPPLWETLPAATFVENYLLLYPPGMQPPHIPELQ